MPSVTCPVPGCDYTTPDTDAVIVAALLTTHATLHKATATAAAKVEKVKRPTIIPETTSEGWTYFTTRWNEYKAATQITGRDIIVQLLECCEEQLRKDLTRSTVGQLTDKTEADILAAIKTLAVREENVMVARVTLNNLTQDHNESIRAFGARLRGQAGVCKYTIDCPNCNHKVDYTEPILRDVLSRGIVDPDIQLELLGHTNQDMTLEGVFHFVETKEAGKRSATHLFDNQSAAIKSTYSKNKKEEMKTRNNDTSDKSNTKCSYCGLLGHNSTLQSRRESCPAFNHTCGYCQRQHHFDHVCRKDKAKREKPKQPDSSASVTEPDTVFASLCAIESQTLPHYCHDKSTNTWKKKPSKPQPFLPVSIKIVNEDYQQLGLSPIVNVNENAISIQAMADTGSMNCLAGYKYIQRLGLNKKDLIPVSMLMNAANHKSIKILGGVLLSIHGKDQDDNHRETRQLTYITSDSDKFYLSESACIDLGIISRKFPTIGEADDVDANTAATTSVDTDISSDCLEECRCPKRSPPPPIPSELPFPAVKENREKLQNFLLDHYSTSTFNTCEHQPLPLMKGPPMTLLVDPKAEPVAHQSPIPIPVHWQEKVKADLDRDVRLGVIEPVPVGESPTWCHRMVICAKKNGNPRRTVDFQSLNAHAARETHHTQSPYHQVRSVPSGKIKTVSDAWNGYHSVPLREEDKHLTTFITPWGRYRYRSLPQGYISSGDGYSRRFDEIVSDFPDKIKVIDDALLWSDDLESSFFQACKWLDICGRNGIIQNPTKFMFGKDTVEFSGFEITSDNVRPAPAMLNAISDFPVPKNLTDIRSWFGLVNQVSYAFSMTDKMLPFRELLTPKTTFHWDENLQQIFEDSKKRILEEIEHGVKIFDKTKPTCIATDWSKSGIGFWLFQKHCHCSGDQPFCCKEGWQVVLVGSRFTHPAESRYAPIEGEALAVADALDKSRHFVLGCEKLTVAVDHKPLLGLFNNRSLDDIPNNRLRNLKERTLRYKFTMYHVPGMKNRVPDALSRYPTGLIAPDQLILPDDIASMTSLQPIQSITWDRVRLSTTSDPDMRTLVDIIDSGIPTEKEKLPTSLQRYHQFGDHLSTIDGVALYKDRIIIPPSLRKEVLTALHAAHHGVTSMTARAESSVFWPGITNDIINTRKVCDHCNRMAPSQPSAPPTPLTYPEYPFQYICGDFFHYQGHYYLVCVDRYSNWPIVEESREGAKSLINSLRRTFVTYGIPDELSSDGGPEFKATSTETFLRNWGVNHRRSSVAFPHSNCRAEIGVKTVKRMLTDNIGPNGELDTEAFQRAMLQYRNTPNQDTKLSPAMCLFGRPIKDFIPIIPGKYKPHPTWQSVLDDRETALRQRHLKMAEALKQHTKRLPPLRVGDRVRIQNQTGLHPKKWDKTGSIVEVKQYDQYVVSVDGSRRVTLRNRKFLRHYIPVHQPAPPVVLPPAVRPTAPFPTTSTAPSTPANQPDSTQLVPLNPSNVTDKSTSSNPTATGTQPADPHHVSTRRSIRIRRPPLHLNDYET